MTEHSPIKKTTIWKIIIGLVAIAGAGLIFVATKNYGAGMSPDSASYLSVAKNIFDGKGFIIFSGDYFVYQPPLYPLGLAAGSWIFQSDPFIVANLFNTVIFGLIVYFSGLLFLRYLPSFPLLAIFGTLAILFSIPLLHISVMVWTEPLFILMTILSFLAADSYFEKGTIRFLIPLSIFVSLAILTRYIGIILLLWGASIILFFRRDLFKTKVIHPIVFGSISSLPIGSWMLRNYLVSHSLMGTRSPSKFSLTESIRALQTTIANWIVPIKNDPKLPLVLLLLISLIIFSIAKGIKNRNSLWKQRAQLGIFVFLYTTFLTISASIYHYDPIDNRLLSPIFIPIILLLLMAFASIPDYFKNENFSKVYRPLLLLGLSLWLIFYPAQDSIHQINVYTKFGINLNNILWQQNELILFLKQNDDLDQLCSEYYSNAGDIAYMLTGIPSLYSPNRIQGGKAVTPADIEGLWPQQDDTVCLIWFNNSFRPLPFEPEELEEVTDMEVIAEFEEGAVYSVERK